MKGQLRLTFPVENCECCGAFSQSIWINGELECDNCRCGAESECDCDCQDYVSGSKKSKVA